jgi:hypothetical protein
MRRPPASGVLPDRALAAPIKRVQTSAYRIPTVAPESDGTLEWDSTTLVVAEVEAGGSRGLGYTYATTAAATAAASRRRRWTSCAPSSATGRPAGFAW